MWDVALLHKLQLNCYLHSHYEGVSLLLHPVLPGSCVSWFTTTWFRQSACMQAQDCTEYGVA